MPLCMAVDLGKGHIALKGDTAPPKGAQQPPSFLCEPSVISGKIQECRSTDVADSALNKNRK